MSKFFLLIAITPLLVRAGEQEIAGQWEWMEIVDQEEQTLDEFFAENKEILTEKSTQEVVQEVPQGTEDPNILTPPSESSIPLKKSPLGQVTPSNKQAKPGIQQRVGQVKPSCKKPEKLGASGYGSSSMNPGGRNQMVQGVMPNTWNGHRMAVGDVNWYLEGDFLWWKANESGLDFCVTKNFPVFESDSFAAAQPIDGFAGRVHVADYSWQPGFRIDLGYRSDFDAWEAFGEYTWYQSDENKTSHHVPYSGLQPALAGTLDEFTQASPYSFYVNRASSKLDVTYSAGDIAVARRFDVSKNVLLKLYAGARGVYLHRDWTVEYMCLETHQQTKHELDWNFRGYGLRFGVDSEWYLGWGLELFTVASASAVYGKHQDHVKTESTFDPWHPLQRAPIHDLRNVYNTQFAGGLAWGDVWNSFGFKLFAAWEVNAWYNVAEQYRVQIPNALEGGVNVQKTRTLDTGVFSIQGLTAGLSLVF